MVYYTAIYLLMRLGTTFYFHFHTILFRRLLIMPREAATNDGKVKSLGIFVQCNPKSPESA